VDGGDNWKHLHPKLQRSDGQIFVIVRRAGSTKYTSAVEDPFFRASTKTNTGFYTADREVTALGCVEQYQFFLHTRDPPWFGSPWGDYITYLTSVVMQIYKKGDVLGAANALYITRSIPRWLSVYDYLWINSGTPAFLESRFIPGNSIVRTEINSTAQWEREVRAWFHKSFIYGKLQIRAIAVNDLPPSEEYTNMPMNISLCNRILATDSGYVNIFWFWFWLTISSLLFVNFISLFYTIECLRVRWIYMKNLLVKSYLRLKRRNRTGDVPLDLDDWSAYTHRDSTDDEDVDNVI
jgi:hypothetical protein